MVFDVFDKVFFIVCLQQCWGGCLQIDDIFEGGVERIKF